MSGKYKTVMNGRGTCLEIGQGEYISVGQEGLDVMIRGNGLVVAFPTWEDLVLAINVGKASYHEHVRMDRKLPVKSLKGGRA